MARPIEFEQTRAEGLAVLRELLRAMRPRDWIKNVFLFAAIAFSQNKLWRFWDDATPLLTVVAAFVLFSMVAGAIYLINDLVDIEKDRAHPKKRNRPLASGRLSQTAAMVATVVLLLVAIPGGFALDYSATTLPTGRNFDFGVTLIVYLFVQGIAYSYYLKNVVLLDIFTIAAGFVLRAVAGALVINIGITPWLLICMGLLALFLGAAKRRAELVLLESGAGEHRRILQEYSLPMLDQMMSIITAATVIAYILFTVLAPTLPQNPPWMMLTVPFVLYAIFRYLYLIYKQGEGGSPAEIVLGDRPFTVSIVLWGLTVLAVLAFA